MKMDIINENAYISTSVELLEESTFGGTNKIKFRAKLQEANVLNNNGRTYPTETLKVIVEQLGPKASERKLLGEFDHPSPQGDTQARMKRSSTISLQNSAVLFTKLEFDGRFIIADCETLTNDHGMNLYRLLKDKVSIGFSLRAFGSSSKGLNGETIVNANGLKALTFDVVSNPSHSNAVIYEFLDESTNIMTVAQDLLSIKQEIVEVILESDGTGFKSVTEDGECACTMDGTCLKGTINESVDYLLNMSLEKNTIKKFNFDLV